MTLLCCHLSCCLFHHDDVTSYPVLPMKWRSTKIRSANYECQCFLMMLFKLRSPRLFHHFVQQFLLAQDKSYHHYFDFFLFFFFPSFPPASPKETLTHPAPLVFVLGSRCRNRSSHKKKKEKDSAHYWNTDMRCGRNKCINIFLRQIRSEQKPAIWLRGWRASVPSS